jgi:hypothetical protein
LHFEPESLMFSRLRLILKITTLIMILFLFAVRLSAVERSRPPRPGERGAVQSQQFDRVQARVRPHRPRHEPGRIAVGTSVSPDLGSQRYA